LITFFAQDLRRNRDTDLLCRFEMELRGAFHRQLAGLRALAPDLFHASLNIVGGSTRRWVGSNFFAHNKRGKYRWSLVVRPKTANR